MDHDGAEVGAGAIAARGQKTPMHRHLVKGEKRVRGRCVLVRHVRVVF